MATDGAHAIVIGASLAGLAAAAGLAGRFDRVTVVDRDDLPEAARPRTGVPQSRHGHILLPAGLRDLDVLLPGIADDLVARGAHLVPLSEVRFHLAGADLACDDPSLELVGATRPLLESVVRARVRDLPGVDVVPGRDARGLATTADRARATGLRVRAHGGAAERTIDADLIVDAGGRGSPTPRWLADLGHPAPPEERFAVGVHYATRLFDRRVDDIDGCRHAVATVPPGGRRGGFVVAVEDDRVLVTLVGVLGERPPTDLAGFVDYAASLDTGDLHEVVAGGVPASQPATGAFPAYLRRRYDRLQRFPRHYAVVGDAVCSFNPLYAQGMTVALHEARVLGEVVGQQGPARVGPTCFRRTRSVIDTAWSVGTGADLGQPDLAAQRTAGWHILNRYLGRLFRVAHRDATVANAYLRVVSMVARPPSLMRPRIAWRVLAASADAGARPGARGEARGTASAGT